MRLGRGSADASWKCASKSRRCVAAARKRKRKTLAHQSVLSRAGSGVPFQGSRVTLVAECELVGVDGYLLLPGAVIIGPVVQIK